MKAATLTFECFDLDVCEDAAPSPDFVAGHAAGLAEAMATAAAQQDLLQGSAVQAISDMAFGYAEARQHLLAGLRPLFAAVIERLVPESAAAALVPQVVEMLMREAESGSRGAIEIAVCPGHVAALDAVAQDCGGMPVRIVADPDLGSLTARWQSPDAATLIDLGAVQAAITSALAAVAEPEKRTVSHG